MRTQSADAQRTHKRVINEFQASNVPTKHFWQHGKTGKLLRSISRGGRGSNNQQHANTNGASALSNGNTSTFTGVHNEPPLAFTKHGTITASGLQALHSYGFSQAMQ